ncbi:hypothetical protein LK494_07805 [Anaerovorax odorimutans]|nr:hypothetical protein [Anaerovorax odorimutans]
MAIGKFANKMPLLYAGGASQCGKFIGEIVKVTQSCGFAGSNLDAKRSFLIQAKLSRAQPLKKV